MLTVEYCVTQISLNWVGGCEQCVYLVTSASSKTTLIWMTADKQMLQLLNIKFQRNVTSYFEMLA